MQPPNSQRLQGSPGDEAMADIVGEGERGRGGGRGREHPLQETAHVRGLLPAGCRHKGGPRHHGGSMDEGVPCTAGRPLTHVQAQVKQDP